VTAFSGFRAIAGFALAVLTIAFCAFRMTLLGTIAIACHGQSWGHR